VVYLPTIPPYHALPGTPCTYTSPASARVPVIAVVGVQRRSPGLILGFNMDNEAHRALPSPKDVREEGELCALLLPLSRKKRMEDWIPLG